MSDDAMEAARQALARMERHEILCNQRHKQIADNQNRAAQERAKMHRENTAQFATVNGRIDRLYNRAWAVLIAVIGLETAALGFFLAQKLAG